MASWTDDGAKNSRRRLAVSVRRYPHGRMGKNLELALAVLNGAVGDYLARTGNGLATPMQLIHRGRPIARIDRAALASAYPHATPRAVLLIPGVMCTEHVWELPTGGDYGAFLARDLRYTPLYLRYNTGLAIPSNGAELARVLGAIARAYPVPLEEILLLGFSMGGLVARSACHVARLGGDPWLSLVTRAVYVGTPHLGAPYERLGRALSSLLRAVDDPYTRLIAQLADLRSDGVKDLGDADVRHEDRARRGTNISLRDARHPVPLLPEIRHYLIAGSLSGDARIASIFGDALVPVPSATKKGAAIPPSHVRVMPGMAHMTLAHHSAVYAQILAWCDERASEASGRAPRAEPS